MKTCKSCQKEKPFKAFYRKKNTKDGYSYSCIKCLQARKSRSKAKAAGVSNVSNVNINDPEDLNWI